MRNIWTENVCGKGAKKGLNLNLNLNLNIYSDYSTQPTAERTRHTLALVRVLHQACTHHDHGHNQNRMHAQS